MSAKRHGKGTKVIFTPDGGSAFTGVFGPSVTEQGVSAPPVDANEIDSDYQQRDPSEVPDLGSIQATVYYDPENKLPAVGTKGVLRIEDPITNPANNTPSFRQGDGFIEEATVARELNNKMIQTIKFTFSGTNYTEDVEKTV
jgi:hypothetical protein